MIVLGIETSCDETGVGIVEDTTIRANLVASQTDLHARFGGVVPEVASRAHLTNMPIITQQALSEAGMRFEDMDAIAVTSGPGLIGALLVGLSAAKSYALALDIPLIGVHHLEGHVESAFLERPDLKPPLLSLIVSGGHTMIVAMPEHGRFEIMGTTIDDAAGEAFDKVARFLGLGFPGGPLIDKLARDGDPQSIPFPRAMMHEESYDFSLSGLKTAVIRWIRQQEAEGKPIPTADVAASFQEAIVDVQVAKTLRAAKERGIAQIVVAGGVAANSRLRERMTAEGAAAGLDVIVPSVALCTDNGAMIAAAGIRHLERGETSPLDISADPNLQLS